MKPIVKYTLFFIVSFMFCLLTNVNNIKASSDYIYYDNDEEVILNVEENNITTYKDFVDYIIEINNIPASRISVFKWSETLGTNPVNFYNTFEGDDTPFLEFLPSESCYVYFQYHITVKFDENESTKIYSDGHRIPELSKLNKKGYDFKGWYMYDDNDRYIKVDFDNIYLLDDITVYAEYTKQKDYKTWIIIGCIGFLTVSSIVTYLIKKKDRETSK